MATAARGHSQLLALLHVEDCDRLRMRAVWRNMAAPSDRNDGNSWEEGLRRRRGTPATPHPPEEEKAEPEEKSRSEVDLQPGSFWLTRIVLLRAISAIYFVAFLVAFHQNKQLIGDRGLLPCKLYLENIKRYVGGTIGLEAVSYAPSVLWLLDWSHMDTHLDNLALVGLGISAFVALTGCANMILMATLWILYHSLVAVGQRWYSFGWESQLLETGFLGIFLCPVWSLSRVPQRTRPSRIVIWAFRWLIFRIMLGAGLIKIRGDKCWRDLTCMDYHYETQPVPNPLAYYMHRNPTWFHQFETLVNHFIELIVPFFIFMGRRMCALHGILQILFQILLILSGNLSFLNWLTIVPSIACFDDVSLGFLFSSRVGSAKHRATEIQKQETSGGRPPRSYGSYVRQILHISLGILIAYLSIPVVMNLMNSKQVMNTSFNPLRIVNTYGAFGSITKERTEVIIQGTSSLNASDPNAVWEEYEFKCKPGNLTRRPCVISPYHYRLDWLIWFAAFQVIRQGKVYHSKGSDMGDMQRKPCATKEFFEGLLPERWAHYNKLGELCVTKEYIEGELPENCGNINKPGMPKKLETYEHNEWLIHLAGKLLANDETATSLLAVNPFQDREPPRWIRGEHYRYKFSRIWGTHASEGKWWIRKRIAQYFPPINLPGLQKYFNSRSWPLPSPS